ncbi:hypothetical protein C8Q76DRAFT_591135, partial [Earliella scabrosa]
MSEHPEYERDMFLWLENLIKSELMGDNNVVSETNGVPLTRPRYSERDGYIHPGVRHGPQIDDIPPAQFKAQYESFVNELVEQYNWHEHTETCWKYLRRSDPRTDQNCRMRMDGVTRLRSLIDEETGSILLRRLHPRIANYNDLIIFLMKCNMDIKHIGSGEGAKALIYYVTDYITKSSLPAYLGLAALMYAINRTHDKYSKHTEWSTREDNGALTIVINSMLCRQEFSHPQIMSYLVGGGDHYTSHRYRILHLGAFQRRVRNALDNPARESSTADLDRDVADDTHPADGGDLNNAEDPPETEVVSSSHDENTITLALGPGSMSALNQQQDYEYRPTNDVFGSMSLYEYVGLTEKITMRAEVARI